MLGYEYYGDGAIATQTDAAGAHTVYTYDPLGHLQTTTDPLGRTTTYHFDGVGNVKTKADPGGDCTPSVNLNCTVWEYDAANQLKTITYSDGVTPNVSNIGYDDDGQRTAMTDGTGNSSWAYDSLNRMTSSTDGAGRSVGYGYDLKSALDPSRWTLDSGLSCPGRGVPVGSSVEVSARVSGRSGGAGP